MATPPKSAQSAASFTTSTFVAPQVSTTPSAIIAPQNNTTLSIPSQPARESSTIPETSSITSESKPNTSATASGPNIAKTLFQKSKQQQAEKVNESSDKALESSKQELLMKIQEGINVYQAQLLQNISMGIFQFRRVVRDITVALFQLTK